MDTIPNSWEYMSPIEAKKPVSIFTPIYGPDQTRGYGDGSPQHAWELGADDSAESEFLAMKAFWNAKYPGVAFWLNDPVLGEKRTYIFISDLSYHYKQGLGYAWKVRIKEVYPYVVTP